MGQIFGQSTNSLDPAHPLGNGSKKDGSGDGGAGELRGCRMCGLVQWVPADLRQHGARCWRCGTRLDRCRSGSRVRTLTLALAALALYAPANLYPVMSMDLMGRHSENTVWSGVVNLCQDGQYFIGAIVFVASILIPALKLMGLFFLALAGSRCPHRAKWIYQIISKIGPWAMLDVFLLAIAVALIKFGRFGHVSPGSGMIWFTLVVALTMLASASFDSRLIWQGEAPVAAKRGPDD